MRNYLFIFMHQSNAHKYTVLMNISFYSNFSIYHSNSILIGASSWLFTLLVLQIRALYLQTDSLFQQKHSNTLSQRVILLWIYSKQGMKIFITIDQQMQNIKCAFDMKVLFSYGIENRRYEDTALLKLGFGTVTLSKVQKTTCAMAEKCLTTKGVLQSLSVVLKGLIFFTYLWFIYTYIYICVCEFVRLLYSNSAGVLCAYST